MSSNHKTNNYLKKSYLSIATQYDPITLIYTYDGRYSLYFRKSLKEKLTK